MYKLRKYTICVFFIFGVMTLSFTHLAIMYMVIIIENT